MHARERVQVLLAYAAFVLVGISAAVGGVLLPAQMADYGVDRPTVGITFFTFSAGFMLAGAVTGPLIHRLGFRRALAVGCAAVLAAGLYLATRPPFAGFVAVQVLFGLGVGTLESILNAHLTTLPSATVLLGRLHAFFGVGALVGPVLAAWVLRSSAWTAVVLITTLPFAAVLVGFLLAHQDVTPPDDEVAPERPRGMLGAVLRQPPVVLAAAFLAVYVGLEISVGNWGFSYLVGERDRSDLVAGNAVSGFWLGLTLGRFLISPVTERLRWPAGRATVACLAGVIVAAAVVWVVPVAGVAVAGLGVLGFFLGPLFPTTMAVMPLLTEARYVPSAIGLLNGVSVIGGSALPWLAGALTQGVGLWTLLPWVGGLAVVQLVLWLRLVPHFATRSEPAAGTTARAL